MLKVIGLLDWQSYFWHMFSLSLACVICCTRRDKLKGNFNRHNEKLTDVVLFRKVIIQYMYILVWNIEILTRGLDFWSRTRHNLALDFESCTLGWIYHPTIVTMTDAIIKLLNLEHIGLTLSLLHKYFVIYLNNETFDFLLTI